MKDMKEKTVTFLGRWIIFNINKFEYGNGI